MSTIVRPAAPLCLRTRLTATTATKRCARALHSRIPIPQVPEPTPFVPTTEAFLTLIGRSLSSHAAKIPSWQALFTLSSSQLRDLGIEPARSRKYLLRWRDKFRRGEFGIGGDCAHVDPEGRAELRVVDVPIGSNIERKSWMAVHGSGENADSVEMAARTRTGPQGIATVTRSDGTRRIVVNVPIESVFKPESPANEQTENAEESIEDASKQTPGVVHLEPLSAAALDKSHPITAGIKYRGSRGLVGSHVEPVKGTSGRVAVIRVQQGLWEDVRGHKIDGGERRQAEVRAKRRAAERRAGVR